VGVNAYQVEEDPADYPALAYPDAGRMQAYLAQLAAYKAQRSAAMWRGRWARWRRRRSPRDQNIFAQVVVAAEAGATHGEICGTLRRELGFGQPLTVV
jgi:methylmalonyl-CoA mutase N-terminal domain/subunit